jgi:SAM-dependent methyltransferase
MNAARWNAYLAIEYKAETGGRGNDDTNPVALKKYVDYFTQHCPVKDYYSVFDPGAGAGASVRALKDLGYNVVGYTLGQDNITLGKEKYNVTLIEQDMHLPAFNDNSFDAIFAEHVAEHALSLHVLLIEFYRILRVGGRLMLAVPDPERPEVWALQWHHSLHTPEQWEKYLTAYGFKKLHSQLTGDGYDSVWEKLPPDKHPLWEYVKYIYEALNKATNGP